MASDPSLVRKLIGRVVPSLIGHDSFGLLFMANIQKSIYTKKTYKT